MFSWVSDCLRDPGCTYELVLPSRKPLLAAGQSVREADLVPAITLNFRYEQQHSQLSAPGGSCSDGSTAGAGIGQRDEAAAWGSCTAHPHVTCARCGRGCGRHWPAACCQALPRPARSVTQGLA